MSYYAINYPITACYICKRADSAYSSTDLSKTPFYDISGTDFFPHIFGTIKKIQKLFQVFFKTTNCLRNYIFPNTLKMFKHLFCFRLRICIINIRGSCANRFLQFLRTLIRNIPEFMHPTSLLINPWINKVQSIQQTLITIYSNELKVFSFK